MLKVQNNEEIEHLNRVATNPDYLKKLKLF